MKLYHGTTTASAEEIEAEGFYGSDLSEFTDGFKTTADGVVFLTDSIEEAQGYGDTVFCIEMLNVAPTFFQESPVSNAKEYYVSVADLRNDGIVSRI
jgi:hypothetical protein